MATWRHFKKMKNRTRYTVTGKDHLGIVRQMPAFAREDLSAELARNINNLVEHKRNNVSPPPGLVSWVQGLAPDIKNRLIDFGLLDMQAKPITDHLNDYEAVLKAKGSTPLYVRITISRIKSVVDGCRLRYWPDVQASKVQC